MQYKAYIFDLDGTLYSRDHLIQNVVTAQYQAFSEELGHVERSEYISRVLTLDEHGYRSKDEVYRELARQYSLSNDLTKRLHDHFWTTYDEHIEVPADTLKTLAAIRANGAKIGIVTNGQTGRQQNKISALGISGLLDQVLISETEQIKKPNPQIFQRALERLGVSAKDAVFIGDHPIADIDGARNAGIDAIWKRTPYWQMTRSEVRVIDNLLELLD